MNFLRKLQDLEWIIWVVSALVAIGVTYGMASTRIDALSQRIDNVERQQLETTKMIEKQLDRIEQHVISIEEHLRNGNQYGPH